MLLLLASTVITYASGLMLQAIGVEESLQSSYSVVFVKFSGMPVRKQKNLVVAASFILNLGILFFFKYFNFFFSVLAQAFAAAHIELNMPQVDVLLPVGVSSTLSRHSVIRSMYIEVR